MPKKPTLVPSSTTDAEKPAPALVISYGDAMAARMGALALASAPFPVRLALKLAALARMLRPHVEDFDNVRQALLSTYAVLDAHGSRVLLPDGNFKVEPGFDEDYREALRRTVTIAHPVRILASEIPTERRGAPIEIEGIVFDQLGPFFVQDLG